MTDYRAWAAVGVLAVLFGAFDASASGEVKVLVRVGLKNAQTPVKLSGPIKQGADGSLNLPAEDPQGWVSVGSGEPMKSLEGLQSFTICGWARPATLQTGLGGNRIAFNLRYNKSGFDLVHNDRGGLRLAVNQWPDNIRNDSSAGKLRVGKWTFLAVTYDSAGKKDNVRWYFGDPKTPAALDKATSYNNGPTGSGSGPLTIGNYNETIHNHGVDRQFRGQLHAVQIFGSKSGSDGALSVEAIRKLQADAEARPDFNAPAPKFQPPARGAPNPTDAADDIRDTTIPPAGTRPRIIATTDGEIDDRCSMVRFLLYANEWDIEGIIYCSSKFHWKGHHWAGEKWIERDIDMYAKFYDTLKTHAPGFPTPKQLKAVTYIGNIDHVGEMTKVTPGSRRIVEVLLDDKPGPVYLQAWGGTNTIARALKTIAEKHPDQVAKVTKKAIIFIILDQDNTFRRYIEPNWPGLQVLGSFRQFACVAYSWDRKIPRELHKYYDAAWMRANILEGHGPLCARYEHHPKKGFRSEGDSPAFMHQILVGLRSLEHPGYGGWGGRFAREGRGRKSTWRGARDDGDVNKPIWRWSAAFENDWAARADWCVRKYSDANHPPKVKLAGALDRTAKPGDKIVLDAAGSSDPDGDKLSYKWWRYDDVDTAEKKIEITGSDKRRAGFIVPDEPGKTIHIILEAEDSGDPPLTRYARVIVKIANK